MLAGERHHLIVSLLRQYRFLSVHDVATRLGMSLATVRRDLDALDHGGAVRRIHGGVELATDPHADRGLASPEVPFARRAEMDVEKKRRIAEKAVSLCQDGETIIIDGGTTTFHMAEFLLNRSLQVLTNSLAIAEILVPKSANRVILSGGAVFPDSKLILDPFGNDTFKDYVASMVFMGVNGIGPYGVTNTDTTLIRIERAMIERGEKLVILADSSKFRQAGSLVLCGFERIDTLITDAEITAEAREMVEGKGVKLVAV